MSSIRRKSIATALAIVGVATLTGCGSSSTPPPVGNIGGGVVSPVPGVPVNACMPISSQIGFNGTGVYIDSANIRGGAIPGAQQIGQMTVTPVAAGGPFQRSGVDGTISMNVLINQAVQQPGYPGGTGYPPGYWPQPMVPSTANVTGFITINPATQQDIMYKFGGGYSGYPTYPTYPGTMPVPAQPVSQPCVSGIAIDTGHRDTQLYNIRVFLYLNNTQHGYILYP